MCIFANCSAFGNSCVNRVIRFASQEIQQRLGCEKESPEYRICFVPESVYKALAFVAKSKGQFEKRHEQVRAEVATCVKPKNLCDEVGFQTARSCVINTLEKIVKPEELNCKATLRYKVPREVEKADVGCRKSSQNK